MQNSISRNINLSRKEIDYLANADFLPNSLLEKIPSINWKSTSSTALELSPEVAEEFREAFTEQLAKIGFDDAYELNAEGKLLEHLIDRFNEPTWSS